MSLFPFFKNNHAYDHPFAMDIWDPISDLNEKLQHMSASHEQLFHNNRAAPFGGAGKVEWSETAEAHVIRVHVPGLKREEVKVKVRDGNVLLISGKKKEEREEKHENFHHIKRSKGKFSRVFSLPENSRPGHVRSSLENGVLIITVPKRDYVHKEAHDVIKNIDVKG